MKIQMLLLAVAASAVLAIGAPAQLEAQDCTVKCSCVSSGCGCTSSGGNGEECSASGDGCFVTKCGAGLDPVTFAPDGSVLDIGRFASGDVSRVSGSVVEVSPFEWRQVSPGHSVAMTCDGLIVAHYFSASRAQEIREAAATITL